MWHGLAVFFTALVLYGSGCAFTVQGGDAGEFMTLAATGGVAHPPGYPLFVWMLRLCNLLPVANVAWKASFAAAVFAAGALALLHDSVRRLSGSTVAGFAAAVALGLSPTFWRYATVAEVFAGGAFTAMLVVNVAARIEQGWRGWRAALALGLAVATGIANHHTVILLAPLAFYAGFRCLERPLRDTAVCAAGQGVGFLAYASLALPGGAWRWGDTSSLDGILHHLLRRDYGTFDLALSDLELAWWEHPLHFAERLPWTELFGVWFLLALVGLAFPRRRFVLALVATAVLAGPVFLTQFNVPVSGLGLVVAHRFTILPIALLCVLAGLGFGLLERRLQQSWLPWLLLPLAAAQGHTNRDLGNHAGWTVLEDYIVNTLSVVEPNAVVIVASDNLFFGGLYVQEVLKVRPDVVLLHPRMMSYPWYRAHLQAQHPDFQPVYEASIPEIVALNVESRPVYLSQEHLGRPALVSRIPPAYPESGVLMRVSAGVLPSPQQVEAQMLTVEDRMVWRSQPETARQLTDTWEGWALYERASIWETLGGAYRAMGDEAGALRCRERSQAVNPWVSPPE